MFKSDFALAIFFSAFFVAIEIFLDDCFRASSFIFYLALIFMSASSEIGSLMRCSGKFFGSFFLVYRLNLVLSKARVDGGTCLGSFFTLVGLG